MQRLVNAIDKATRAGAYTLEETAQILQALDQVGAIVTEHQQYKEAERKAQEKAMQDAQKKEAEMTVVPDGPAEKESVE